MVSNLARQKNTPLPPQKKTLEVISMLVFKGLFRGALKTTSANSNNS